MHFLTTQRSISRPAAVRGVGYFSGNDVTVEFRPAETDTGLVFVRTDLSVRARIPVSVDYRVDAARRTVLARGSIRVEMVEHVLAALAGTGVDNCQIWIDQAELPGNDGSAEAFTDALVAAEIVDLAAPRRRLLVDQTVRVGDDRTWIEARPPQRNVLSIDYCLDYGEGPIGRQKCRFRLDEHEFRRELAPARTFLLQEEAVEFAKQGLGKRVTSRDLLIFGERGPIDNRLRYDNECARHKVLDVIGDMALAGCDIIGHVVCHRSGHHENAMLVTELLETHAIDINPSLRAVA